ncbi:MAG: DUF294 nucleotidyltransferase-like domain-containing protein, partial [Opitutus sp.]
MSVLPATSADLLAFTDTASPADRLAACKAYLQAEMAALRARHAAGASGLEVARGRAAFMDRMLQQLFEHAMSRYIARRGRPAAPVALIALGGYGRRELSPLSDIDVMFLFPAKTKPTEIKELLEHLTNEILYPLWDCGLKVGHSVRNVD